MFYIFFRPKPMFVLWFQWCVILKERIICKCFTIEIGNKKSRHYLLTITPRHRRVEKYFLVAYILNDKSYVSPVILLRVVLRRFVENNFFPIPITMRPCLNVNPYIKLTGYTRRTIIVFSGLFYYLHSSHTPDLTHRIVQVKVHIQDCCYNLYCFRLFSNFKALYL